MKRHTPCWRTRGLERGRTSPEVGLIPASFAVDSEGRILAHDSAPGGILTFPADGSPYGFEIYSRPYEVVRVQGICAASALP